MKYVVLSPEERIICFDHADQVTEYCSEKEREDLNAYCEEQELEYENMTAVEVGYLYSLIGNEDALCKVYETREVLNALKEQGSDEEDIEAINELFNNRRLNREVNCPAVLKDVLGTIEDTPISELLSGTYKSSDRNMTGRMNKE